MSEESLTLYKLMILFMLDNLDFPLTNSQLSEFFVNHGYTSYFHLQQAINEPVSYTHLSKVLQERREKISERTT